MNYTTTKPTFYRIMSIALIFCMLFSTLVMPFGITASAAATVTYESSVTNNNQADGIYLSKNASLRSDGTIGLTLEAYTTGQVTNHTTVIPTDIVLVLDVSGSMRDKQTTTHEVFNLVYAEENGLFFKRWEMDNSDNCYINIGGNYIKVNYSQRDNNRVEYYYYTTGTGDSAVRHYVYPVAENGANPTRQYNYDVVQFYSRSTSTTSSEETKISMLKSAVSAFIDETAAHNALLSDTEDMHRISIVKFADDSYYGGTPSVTEGNHRYSSSGYNYTEVLKNLTTVNASGATSLKTAVDSIVEGGATSVDYGMELAELVLDSRTDAVGRNAVVIVFADGEPNHSSGYDASVATDAINAANVLKKDNVKIYSISVADGADATQLGTNQTNQFMHYISSNYPDAVANDTTNAITAGEGSPSNGYYFTPDNTHNLDMLFSGIASEIGTPHIELGESARVVDTVSDYFTIALDGTNPKITVQTAKATAVKDEWETPVAAPSSVSVTLQGKSLSVTGFDFDENYVSTTARDGNNYGQKLIINVELVPDYYAIDASSITDGLFVTNSGNAQVLDSTSQAIANTASPKLKANEIVYEVDGDEYEDYYRFSGTTGITAIADPTKTGYSFSGWSTTEPTVDLSAPFTMPTNDFVISGNFTANTYYVTYRYSGTKPATASELPNGGAKIPVTFGTEYEIENAATATGYRFVGWLVANDNVDVANDKFTMPAHDVDIYGWFEAGNNTPYHVEHYLEQLDGSYKLHERIGKVGTTHGTVNVAPNYYEGFTVNETHPDNVISGTIADDGSLVLKLHYSRDKHKVTYFVEGILPDGVTVPAEQSNIPYETVVDVAGNLSADGYTFSGWNATNVTVSGGKFTMPDEDVVFVGSFEEIPNVKYYVEHYLKDLTSGSYPTTPNRRTEYEAKPGTTVYPVVVNFPGYTLNSTLSDSEGTIPSSGTLTLKLYYDPAEYTVTYKYLNTEHDGLPALPNNGNPITKTYGETVTVEAPLTLTDHVFHGWEIFNDDITVAGNEFTMPARNVVLVGYFTALAEVEYKVNHHLKNLDGTNGYTVKRSDTFTGKHGKDVVAVPDNFIGYEYNASMSNATGTLDENASPILELDLYYDPAEFTVTYSFTGTVPTGALALLPNSGNPITQKFGDTVDVADDAVLANYTFSGWDIVNDDIDISSGSFTMPARNVLIVGHFTEIPITSYEVYHYLENLDGTYGDGEGGSVEAKKETYSARVGSVVTAHAHVFAGYKFNSAITGTVLSGTIPASGTLVLKLYYDRNTYNVTYEYAGVVPDTASVLPNNGNPIAVKYGATHIIAGDSTASGYDFHGWNSQTAGFAVGETDVSFTMPSHDVILAGHFHADIETPYKINHWLSDENGNYHTHPTESETRHGQTDSSATIYAKTFTGYSFDEATTVGEFINTTTGQISITKDILGTGDTVFDFYYSINTYDVKYEYDGTQPTGAPNVATLGENGVAYGTSLTVESDPVLAGYTFSGWRSSDVRVLGNAYTMPDHDVVFKGTFTANTDTPYTVKYWFRNVADTVYVEDTTLRINGEGTTGTWVAADEKHFDGFIPKSGNILGGYITAAPELVINVYYDRLKYDVTYVIHGTIPDGAEIPAGYNKTNVAYGANIDIEADLVLTGYEFESWRSTDVVLRTTDFTMPNRDVVLFGRFVKLYTVKYDLNGGVGATGVDYSDKQYKEGTVVTVNAAPTRSGYTFEGWENGTETNYPSDNVTVAGDITFKAKWRRNGGGVVIPTITKYTLTYKSNGGTEYSPEKYNEGTNVNITKTPEKHGFIFTGWYLDEALNEAVESVVMNKDITIWAGWKDDKVPEKLDGDHHFAYVIGYDDGTVRPNANITRAETAAIFFRLLKPEVRDANLATENSFSDVELGEWYNINVSTLDKLGIVSAREGDKFYPNEAITRAEFAQICARFDDDEFVVVDHFTDVQGHEMEADIHEAAAHGWIKGYEDNTFRPDELITRAEAMAMINRVLNREPETVDDLLEGMIEWPDNADTTAWYYLDVQEATNNHKYIIKDDKYEEWESLIEGTDWLEFQ